jgi:hypothetical protein
MINSADIYNLLLADAKPFKPGDHRYGYIVGIIFNPNSGVEDNAKNPLVLFDSRDRGAQEVWIIESAAMVESLLKHLSESPAAGGYEYLFTKLWIDWDPITKTGSADHP